MSHTAITENPARRFSSAPWSGGPFRAIRALGAVLSVALLITGCGTATKAPAATETSPTVGARMAGPVVDVKVTQAALDSRPHPPVLTTPTSAVRSYLDWTSYAYRIAHSAVATPTMSPYEEVRVDSYIQYNIQKFRLIDQTLASITFGKPKITGDRATVTARERWTYSYVSIQTAGEVLEGPYAVRYASTYTLVKSDRGGWVVDSVKATALDEVK